MSDVTSFDHFFGPAAPAALVIREPLIPVEGADGVLFPPTFAAGDGFPGGYNIDELSQGVNICLIDSVGSQANRIEPLFMTEPYSSLVPQVEIQAGEKHISLLEAGHRAGDALVRCSSLQEELQAAFHDVLKGSAMSLAKLAPTSLVFGVWDSRDTQAKCPRLVASTIRAFNVRRLTRSAQFNPATEYVKDGLLDEPADKAASDAYAERGFIHVPATGSHGGVVADGGIRRDATLSLAAMLQLKGQDPAETLRLRRYILGLSLVAITANTSGYLRQGCLLVCDPDQPRTFSEVYGDGRRVNCAITHEQALAYALAAAADFGVSPSRTVPFEKDRAKQDLAGNAAKKAKKSARKGKAKDSATAEQGGE